MKITFNANEGQILFGKKAERTVTVPCSATKDGDGIKPVSGRQFYGSGLKMGLWVKKNDGDDGASGQAL